MISSRIQHVRSISTLWVWFVFRTTWRVSSKCVVGCLQDRRWLRTPFLSLINALWLTFLGTVSNFTNYSWLFSTWQSVQMVYTVVSVFSITAHVTPYQWLPKYSHAIPQHFYWLFVCFHSSEALNLYAGMLPSCCDILYYMMDAQLFHHQLVLQRDNTLSYRQLVYSASAGAS